MRLRGRVKIAPVIRPSLRDNAERGEGGGAKRMANTIGQRIVALPSPLIFASFVYALRAARASRSSSSMLSLCLQSTCGFVETFPAAFSFLPCPLFSRLTPTTHNHIVIRCSSATSFGPATYPFRSTHAPRTVPFYFTNLFSLCCFVVVVAKTTRPRDAPSSYVLSCT